jgi:hypothetical protein
MLGTLEALWRNPLLQQPLNQKVSIDCVAPPRPKFTVGYNTEKVNGCPDALYYLRKFAQPIPSCLEPQRVIATGRPQEP